ncbi:MAG: MDR family MFS transporter [Chloroflexota bacterium]|nr:MDR family MFS transporter [Chloroflexota bacterium]
MVEYASVSSRERARTDNVGEQPADKAVAGEPGDLRALPRRQVALTMAGMMLAMFLGSLDQTIVGTAMPRIITDLGGFTQYTWVTTAYIIASTVTVPIVGKLTDIYGRKWFYTAGIAVFAVGSLLCGLSQTMTQIIIFRGLQGIGAGTMMANALILIGDLFPAAERGKYQGLMSGILGISSVIGPTVGGFITDTLSWHWVFFVNVPLALLIICLFVFFFPHLRPAVQRRRIDYFGLVTLVLAVVPAMLALSWAGVEYEWSSAPIIGMFVLSAVAAAAFVLVERRAEEPLMPFAVFRNRIVAVSSIVIFLTGFGTFGAIIFVPLFFQGVMGMSATASGSFLTPMMLGVVIGSIVSGQVLSRTGGHYRWQGVVGLAIMAVGVGMMSRMTVDTSYAAAVAYIVISGIGAGITMPLYVIAIQNAVPYAVMGVATSSTAFVRQLGGVVGLAVYGSALNNRFASQLIAGLSPGAKAAIPQEALNRMTENPQALVSVEAQAQLRAFFEQLGTGGAALYQEVVDALRVALNSALTEIFLIGLVVILIAWVANLFLREIPLRRQRA